MLLIASILQLFKLEKNTDNKKATENQWLTFSDLGEDRTLDPLIKSQLLYRLSYQVVFTGGANKQFFLDLAKLLYK